MIAWTVQHERSDVATLHALGAPTPLRRLLRWCEPTNTALVLGRAQKETEVVSRDINIVRRSSGGGAVLVVAYEIVWFDVVVPVGDPLWENDVMRAFWWLGESIARALGEVGINGAHVYKGALQTRDLPVSVCFAGLGPGEVKVGERKLVGVSQRRTREAALFQCSLFLRHRTSEIGHLLGLTAEQEVRLAGLVVDEPALDVSRFRQALALALP